MQFMIEGRPVFGATGGRAHEVGRPLAIFVHGAALDHSVWALQSRWLAFHGWNVLALDLPGHGLSAGPPLPSIGAMAAWLAAVIAAAAGQAAGPHAAETQATGSQAADPQPTAALIGHSMGSLAALETAAQFSDRVRSLVLIGTAAAMPVHPDLLAAAAANDHAAIDMVNLWGHGFAATLGGSRAPGVWMLGAGERLLEKAMPGVLHNDLAACNAYREALAAAAKVAAPALLISGERDQMTPLKSARALAAKISGAKLLALPAAGHMLMAERPYEIVDALAEHLAVERTRGAVSAKSAPHR
jgi:pimeloyl-ACP methyl ester carboxylesterase